MDFQTPNEVYKLALTIRIETHGQETFAEITHNGITVAVNKFEIKYTDKVADLLTVLSRAIKADRDLQEEEIIEVVRVEK